MTTTVTEKREWRRNKLVQMFWMAKEFARKNGLDEQLQHMEQVPAFIVKQLLEKAEKKKSLPGARDLLNAEHNLFENE